MGGKQTKRPPKREKPAVNTLRQQLQRNGLFKDDLMRLEETEGPKLSAAILELMAPYTAAAADTPAAATTREAFEKLAILAVLAWNAALLEGEERQAMLATAVTSVVESAGEHWRQDTEGLLQTLLARKLSLFADDRRYVVDFRVTETATEYRLAVATIAKRGSGQ